MIKKLENEEEREVLMILDDCECILVHGWKGTALKKPHKKREEELYDGGVEWLSFLVE